MVWLPVLKHELPVGDTQEALAARCKSRLKHIQCVLRMLKLPMPERWLNKFALACHRGDFKPGLDIGLEHELLNQAQAEDLTEHFLGLLNDSLSIISSEATYETLTEICIAAQCTARWAAAYAIWWTPSHHTRWAALRDCAAKVLHRDNCHYAALRLKAALPESTDCCYYRRKLHNELEALIGKGKMGTLKLEEDKEDTYRKLGDAPAVEVLKSMPRALELANSDEDGDDPATKSLKRLAKRNSEVPTQGDRRKKWAEKADAVLTAVCHGFPPRLVAERPQHSDFDAFTPTPFGLKVIIWNMMRSNDKNSYHEKFGNLYSVVRSHTALVVLQECPGSAHGSITTWLKQGGEGERTLESWQGSWAYVEECTGGHDGKNTSIEAAGFLFNQNVLRQVLNPEVYPNDDFPFQRKPVAAVFAAAPSKQGEPVHKCAALGKLVVCNVHLKCVNTAKAFQQNKDERNFMAKTNVQSWLMGLMGPKGPGCIMLAGDWNFGGPPKAWGPLVISRQGYKLLLGNVPTNHPGKDQKEAKGVYDNVLVRYHDASGKRITKKHAPTCKAFLCQPPELKALREDLKKLGEALRMCKDEKLREDGYLCLRRKFLYNQWSDHMMLCVQL